MLATSRGVTRAASTIVMWPTPGSTFSAASLDRNTVDCLDVQGNGPALVELAYGQGAFVSVGTVYFFNSTAAITVSPAQVAVSGALVTVYGTSFRRSSSYSCTVVPPEPRP